MTLVVVVKVEEGEENSVSQARGPGSNLSQIIPVTLVVVVKG